MPNKTIFEVYSDYQASEPNSNSSVLRSVIHRFLAEQWGGKAPNGVKATNGEIIELVELLKLLPVDLLANSFNILTQEFENKGTSKENKKSYKSAYKKFFDWLENNGYFIQPTEESLPEEIDIETNLFSRNAYGSGTKRKTGYHNRKNKYPYILMGRTKNGLIYKDDYINDFLRKEMQLYEKFRVEHFNCRATTIKNELVHIRAFLGWLHRYKNTPLEDLSLKSIVYIPSAQITYTEFKKEEKEDSYQKYRFKKFERRQEIIELANENYKLIEEFFVFFGNHPRSKGIVLRSIISIAKFMFKNEIRTDDFFKYANIPIIERLTDLLCTVNRKIETTPRAIPYKDKSIPWTDVYTVLERLRKRVDITSCKFKSSVNIEKGRYKEYTQTVERSRNAIMNCLQLFLSLAFMVLIPPDRSRTYYELELGRTFVNGLYKDDDFIPIDKLADKNQALWYIHLMPEDYKTGDIYGEYWGIMPNTIFKDGKKLYDYIDLWLKEGRNYKQVCNHNCFFRKTITYGKSEVDDWNCRIKGIFINATGIPVTPKELRKMYVTYLHNKGATHAELKSAAYNMHHSDRMQGKNYNCQTSLDRIKPILELNEKIQKEAFDIA